MAYEMREGQGSLFKNDQKGNERAPNYKGKVKINGEVMSVSGWLKQKEDGEKWLSISVEPTQAQAPQPQARPQARPQPAKATDPFDDDVPYR